MTFWTPGNILSLASIVAILPMLTIIIVKIFRVMNQIGTNSKTNKDQDESIDKLEIRQDRVEDKQDKFFEKQENFLDRFELKYEKNMDKFEDKQNLLGQGLHKIVKILHELNPEKEDREKIYEIMGSNPGHKFFDPFYNEGDKYV